jgi:hypothetical protein
MATRAIQADAIQAVIQTAIKAEIQAAFQAACYQSHRSRPQQAARGLIMRKLHRK